jgi:hypothetical protein
METLIEFLNSTALNKYIMSEAWLWPTLEIFHFFGLCLLLGSVIIFDLRALGVAREVPLIRIETFMVSAAVGFAINLITGIVFIIGDPDRYLPNIAFRIKMILILVAGLNVLYYTWRLRPQVLRGLEGNDLSGGARYVAALSLTLWTCVIVLGRIIPYVEQ